VIQAIPYHSRIDVRPSVGGEQTVKVPRTNGTRRRTWVALTAAATAAILGAWAVRGRTGTGADPELVLRQAEADFAAGQIDRAESALARLARLRAPTPPDRFLTAQVATIRHRYDAAVAELALVPDSHPVAASARLLTGQVELRRHRAGSAERSLRAAIALDPTLVQAHRELIYIYGVMLRRPELNAEFLALSRLVPLTYENVFHWCLTRNTVWEPKELTEELQSFVAADPTDRWSRLALAENLRQVGRHEDAEGVLAPLPATDPDSRAIRVRIALDRGDDQAAEALLADGPADHAGLARLRGRFALAHRDGPSAVKHFRAAYAVEPDDRDTVFGLGQALVMVGDEAAAAPFLAAARDLDALGSLVQRASAPSGRKDPRLLRALGAACEKVQRFPEARAWYNLAIDLEPLDSEAQKALSRLKGREPVRPRAEPPRRGPD
jgi:predicted Zn-dependent protease